MGCFLQVKVDAKTRKDLLKYLLTKKRQKLKKPFSQDEVGPVKSYFVVKFYSFLLCVYRWRER